MGSATNSTSVNGDFVVLQKHNCSNAHQAVTSAASLARTALVNSKVSSVINMTEAATLKVCYASRESLGDSADDYSTLAVSFQQYSPPDFLPKRVAMGALQNLVVTGGATNDSVGWTQDANCHGITQAANSMQSGYLLT